MRWLLLLVAGCGRIAFDPLASSDGATGMSDAMAELGPFGQPQLVTELDAPNFDDDDPSLTSDLLEIFFDSDRQGGLSETFHAVRSDPTQMWSAPTLVTELDAVGFTDGTPSITSDGLVMFIASTRSGGGDQELYITQRADRMSAWSVPVHVMELGSSSEDFDATLSEDRLRVYFTSLRSGNLDLYLAERATTSSSWSMPSPITELNTAGDDIDAWLAADELTVFFGTTRFTGNRDIAVATRASRSDPFGPAVPVMELNSTFRDSDPWLSPDLRTVVFSSDRVGGRRGMYFATR